MNNRQLSDAINQLAAEVYANAIAKGFWRCRLCNGLGCTPCDFSGRGRNVGESLALIHAEVSEALEAKRQPELDAKCDKCDGWGRVGITTASKACAKCGGSGDALGGSRFVEELADVLIRVLDLAAGENVDIGAAVIEKHRYNASRPAMHGKRF